MLGAAVVAALPLGILLLPTPYLDGLLARTIAARVAAQVSCPDATGPAPEVAIRGDRLVWQAIRQRLTEVNLVLPDTTVGGVEHASFAAVLRDVSQPDANTVHVGAIDATITLPFANLPNPPDVPAPQFGRAPDGLLTIEVTPPADSAKNVKATLFLELDLAGETLNLTPRKLRIFGKTIPADQVGDLTGGVRTVNLPALPDGVTYRSVEPRADGLHVALGGVVTTSFTELPANVDGQNITYSAKGGLLGISTTRNIPFLGTFSLTINTAPRIEGNVLRLVPQSVDALGGNHGPDSLVGRAVLSQLDEDSLAESLPDLPNGVRYTGAAVDGSGLKVSLSGVTVKPYSELPTTDENGLPTTYGANDGLMTVSTTGSSRPTPVVLHARPTIDGSTLDLAPQRIRMFGVDFPAGDVVAQVKVEGTRFPLEALPGGLSYVAVDVQADALRLHVSGKDATLTGDAFGGTGC